MTSPLQGPLFSRQPDLHWLLDSQDNLIEPLLHQWGLQIALRYRYATLFSDVKDVFLWAVEKNASAPALQSTFDWLQKTLVTVRAHPKDTDVFLHALKKSHPELLQTLMENVPWLPSVWDTSFALKYAPEPAKLWASQPRWHKLYTGTNPLAWSRKESVHPNASTWAYPDETSMKRMHDIMGHEAFLLWQYGAYLAILTQNIYSSGDVPAGRKYGLAAALMLLEPAIKLGLAPNAETLAQDTVRRYKGQGLVEDMLKGLDYCTEKYEVNRVPQGVNYCSKMLNTIIPHAIKEGLTSGGNALIMDKKITHVVHAGRMDEPLAQTWFEDRIRHAREKLVDFEGFSPLWPEALRKTLVELEATMQRDAQKPDIATTARAMFERCSYEPTATKAFLESLRPAQWEEVQATLDSNANTSAVVSLLQTSHPWIEAYKSSARARISVVAACMIFINEPKYMMNPKYRGLAGLFSADQNTPIGQLSLPQPLAYFAKCFPQYRETWQRLACEMANANPMGSSAKIKEDNSDAKRVVNALTSLMLGKSVDTETLLQMRESLDPDMEYETLVQSQFNITEVFELPETFDANMFSGDGLSM